MSSSTPLSSATSRHSLTKSASRSPPAVVDAAVVGEVLGQPQLALVRVDAGSGWAPAVGVDHEQVHGVGADVEDPEAHAPHYAVPPGRAAGCRQLGTRVRCPWLRPRSTSPAPGSSSPTRPTPSQRFRLRPDLADLELDVHLRQRAARASTPTGPTTAAAPSARTSPTRTTRSGCRPSSSELGEDEWQYHPRHATRRHGRLDRDGGRRAQDPGRRRRLHLPQPARLPGRRRLRPAPARRAHRHGSRTRPSRTSAGSCRSGAPTARVELPDDTVVPRGRRSPSTTAAAGAPAATTSTGTAPATPRRTSAASRSTAPTRAELVELMGDAGVRRARRPLRGAPRAASRRSRARGARKLLPLLVHPATLAAEAPTGPGTLRPPMGDQSIPSPNIWDDPRRLRGREPAASTAPAVIEYGHAPAARLAGADAASTSAAARGFHLPRLRAATPARSSASSRTCRSLDARRSSAWLGCRRPSQVLDGARPATCRWTTRPWTSRTRGGPTSSAPGCEPGLAELARVLRPGGTAFVIDNDATRSTFGRWFRRAYPAYDPLAVERFWAAAGLVTRAPRHPLGLRLARGLRGRGAHRVRPETAADVILAEHDGTGVDYAVNLWWRRF